jgi:hypothetical protein
LSVSQNPYNTANAMNSQNRAGIRVVPGVVAAPARNGWGRLTSSRAASRMADSSGRPHQKPRPTKRATNTGASAVPTPSNALSTRMDESTACG